MFEVNHRTKFIAWGQKVSPTCPAPANTLGALNHANASGFDGVEIDLRISKDKIPVAFHDQSLETLDPRAGNVSDYCFNELQNYCLGVSASGVAERIPTLSALLSAHPHNKIFVGDMRIGAENAARVAEAVHASGFPLRNFLTTAYSVKAANYFKRAMPDAPYFVKHYLPPAQISVDQLNETEGSGLSGVMIDTRKTTEGLAGLVDFCHARELQVITFVHETDYEALLTQINAGVDFILTSRPDLISHFRECSA